MIDEGKPYVAKIEQKDVQKLRADLAEQGFEFSEPPHTLFLAKKEGISCSLFSSLKLVVQGKKRADFIQFYLEPEILKAFSFGYDKEVDTTPRIGVDEAGKGDFLGPLCVAAVYASSEAILQLVRLGVADSKTLSDSKVLELSTHIAKLCACTTVKIGPQRYNELYEKFKNLNHLLAWGHATAIEQLTISTKCPLVILDKFASDHVVLNALKKKNISLKPTQRTHAEEDVVVAAASIMARALFVNGMKQLEEQYKTPFPKGVSPKVKEAARKLVREHGKEILFQVAKCHFKTYQEIVGSC